MGVQVPSLAQNMKTKLDIVSPIKKKITIDLPPERVAEAIEKAYLRVQKKAKLDGFREGKVPRHLLERHFKKHAEEEAVDILVDSSLRDALVKEAIFPVSKPNIAPGPFQKDAEFSYTAEFEVHPEVAVPEYLGLQLEKTERGVKDEDIEKRLLSLQQSMTQLEPADESARVAKGMAAFVDFDGTADGKSFKGSKAENFLVDVGAGSLLPAFEEKMAGMTKGESKKVEFDYPADYFNKELAGKHGIFSVTVKDIKKKRVPELNDDFAKDLGSYKTIAEVKDEIKKRMQSALEHETKTELASQALEVLVKKHKFEVPEAVVISELKGMFESFANHLAAQGKKFEDTGIKAEQFIEQYKPMAEDRVRGYYILSAIAKTEKLEVTKADIEERLKSISAQANQPLPKVREYYEKEEHLFSLKNQLLNEKTLDFVVLKAKIRAKKSKKD